MTTTLAHSLVAQPAARLRERGSSTIQLVVLLPALFSLMFLGVQAALMYQGRTIALAAAQEGAREAATENGTNARGIAAAESFLTTSTAGLSDTTVTAARSGTEVRITVSAKTVSVITGWNPRITQSATLPVERVTG